MANIGKHATYLWWWLGDGLLLFYPHYTKSNHQCHVIALISPLVGGSQHHLGVAAGAAIAVRCDIAKPPSFPGHAHGRQKCTPSGTRSKNHGIAPNLPQLISQKSGMASWVWGSFSHFLFSSRIISVQSGWTHVALAEPTWIWLCFEDIWRCSCTHGFWTPITGVASGASSRHRWPRRLWRCAPNMEGDAWDY